MEQSVAEIVRKMESDDISAKTIISKHVNLSMRDEINKVDAYLHSKHVSGETDAKGREKPFFNIVIAARNVWYRATDIDRKNIRVKATKAEHYALSFIATLLLQEWMRKSQFGKFLNDWGLTLANYGSAVSKFVEKGGELKPEVVSWNRLLVDPVDFENNVKVERLWLTPAQLRRNKNYDQEIVEKLLENLTSRETSERQKKDTKHGYILLYEVHAELSSATLKQAQGKKAKKGDDKVYEQQMHVITFLTKKDKPKEYDDYTLYAGIEAKDPYPITHLIKQDGYTLSGGAVKNLFQSQWMENHTKKAIKDQLDLAGKRLFQTSDGNFVGQNVLSAIEQGDILIHALNQPLTQLNNTADIAALQSFGQEWKSLGYEINGIAESMIMQAKSGTAWRQTQAELQEAHSLFELMTENKGLSLEEMLTDYIIPFLKKKMDTSEEISAILADHQITQLDQMYVPNEAIRRTNNKIKQIVLNGGIVNPEEMETFKQQQTQEIQQGLNQMGNQRFIKPSDIPDKTWKEVLKDFEWELEIDITGEQKDRQAVLETLSTALQVIVNPTFATNKKAQLVVDKILEETKVISPLELSQVKENPAVPISGGQQMAGAGMETALIK